MNGTRQYLPSVPTIREGVARHVFWTNHKTPPFGPGSDVALIVSILGSYAEIREGLLPYAFSQLCGATYAALMELRGLYAKVEAGDELVPAEKDAIRRHLDSRSETDLPAIAARAFTKVLAES